MFPGQCGDIISPPSPGSFPRALPSWTCLEHHPGEAPRGHPYLVPKPPQLAPFNAKEQRLYSERSSRMTELLTLSPREKPATLLRKTILSACTRNLVLSVMIHGCRTITIICTHTNAGCTDIISVACMTKTVAISSPVF